MMTALGAGSFVAMDAHAGESYVGVGLGDSLIRSDKPVRDDYVREALMGDGFRFSTMASSLSTSTRDEQDFGWKIYYGYKFIPQFAIEAEYADLGKGKSDVNGTVDGPEGVSGSHDFEKSGFGVTVVGMLPVKDKLSFFAKLGEFHWKAETSSDLKVASPTPATVKESTSENGTDVHFGLGAEYYFTTKFGARLEWTQYDIDHSDSDLFLIDAVLRF